MGAVVPGLVVSTQQSDSFRVFDFEAEKILEGLDRVVSPINEVSDEDVAGFFNFSS
jgi:hypothetical protein